MSQIQEWNQIQEAYNCVFNNSISIKTKEVLGFIKENSKSIKKFTKTTTVLARQLIRDEIINETKSAKGNWVVKTLTGIAVLKPHEFEYLYENEHPVKGSGAVKMYKSRKNIFWGIVYEGHTTPFVDYKNNTIVLEEGDVIGSFDSKQFEKSLEVIKKQIFQDNFKL